MSYVTRHYPILFFIKTCFTVKTAIKCFKRAFWRKRDIFPRESRMFNFFSQLVSLRNSTNPTLSLDWVEFLARNPSCWFVFVTEKISDICRTFAFFAHPWMTNQRRDMAKKVTVTKFNSGTWSCESRLAIYSSAL